MKKQFFKEYIRLCPEHFVGQVCMPLVFLLIGFITGIMMVPITKLAIVQVVFWGGTIFGCVSNIKDQFVRVYTVWKTRKEWKWDYSSLEVWEDSCRKAITQGFRIYYI